MTALPGAMEERFATPARFEHAFFCSAALVLLALVVAGFAPTFFARDVSALGPLPSAALVHGIAGTAWLRLFGDLGLTELNFAYAALAFASSTGSRTGGRTRSRCSVARRSSRSMP